MPCDYKEYPNNWTNISNYIRFIRAGNKCETCGAENGKPHPDTGSIVVLTVAHIRHDKMDVRYNPIRYDAHDPDNNLVAECQRCHLWRDRFLHAANRRNGRRKGQRAFEFDYEPDN